MVLMAIPSRDPRNAQSRGGPSLGRKIPCPSFTNWKRPRLALEINHTLRRSEKLAQRVKHTMVARITGEMEQLFSWFESQGGCMDRSLMTLSEIPGQGRGALSLKDIPVRK